MSSSSFRRCIALAAAAIFIASQFACSSNPSKQEVVTATDTQVEASPDGAGDAGDTGTSAVDTMDDSGTSNVECRTADDCDGGVCMEGSCKIGRAHV